METVPLFLNKRELFFSLVALFCLFMLSISYEFYKYNELLQKPTFYTQAQVLSVTKKLSKKDKPYISYKLKSDDLIFYTIRWKAQEIKNASLVRVGFLTKNISFYNYLRGFFAPSIYMELIQEAKEDFAHLHVKAQHSKVSLQELYGALFFADSYDKQMRHDISKWGIAHLVAISGFHLGILSAILYFLLKPLYMFFQDKFFPYRNSFADLALLVFVILGAYVFYISAVPSVLRAYVMSLVGFLLFSRNIKIVSFGTLFFTMAFVLILFPKLLFSVAFWFSIAGVFYIFLFLYHFSYLSKVAIFIFINFWVYILMLPIVHYVFDIFTYYQLLSPLISMAFVVFYPLSLILHVINLGGVFDNIIESFLAFEMQILSLHVSLNFLVGYVVLSLLAIRYKYVAYLLPLIALSTFFI